MTGRALMRIAIVMMFITMVIDFTDSEYVLGAISAALLIAMVVAYRRMSRPIEGEDVRAKARALMEEYEARAGVITQAEIDDLDRQAP